MSILSRVIGVLGKAFTGAIIGCLVGGALGYCLGCLAGSFSEVRLTVAELEDIHFLGYPEYVSGGISFVTTLICAAVGSIGGLAGAAVATLRRSSRDGIVTGGITVVIALLASGALTSHSTHWHETKIVEVIGGVISAALAAALARALQRQEELDRTAQPKSDASGAEHPAGGAFEPERPERPFAA
jgi:uncharacterized membrane protein